MTKLEKQMIATMVVLFCSFIVSCTVTIKAFNEAGGFKGIAVGVGKEIKEINKEIDKHE